MISTLPTYAKHPANLRGRLNSPTTRIYRETALALKKGDLRFHVQSVRLASRWKATRYAVFSSILSQAWKEKGVPWAFDMLYLLWRQRLDELRAEGWVPIQNDTNFTYIRNCPPFGVKT